MSGCFQVVFNCRDIERIRHDYIKTAAYYVALAWPQLTQEQCWLVGEHEIDNYYSFVTDSYPNKSDPLRSLFRDSWMP
jgi:hypothetical protein